ncbi:MAG TPA: aspartate kinase [Candidatus Acidoferrales bacterium]|nr:aspartate kinase [Candidatus Acidoferrales bacterium]
MQRAVMKFGGTSVGIAANFARALELVARRAREDARPPIVVVSALTGVTNLLVEWCALPSRREALAARFVERHESFADEVDVARATIAPLLAQWREQGAAAGPAGVSGAARDEALAFGERLAAALFAAGLRAHGLAAQAVTAGEAGLVTDERFGAAHPLPEAAAGLARTLGARDDVAVVTGFLGRTPEGRTTTLGRGGSDYSAAIVGAALGADEIQIWTDTSGLLSADPRIVPEARAVASLSFAEASELAYFGARVLHPKTLLPAMERGIAVRILNTARPDDPGSLVTAETTPSDAPWRVKSIACKKAVTAVTIVSTRMLLAHGFLARVFEVFGRHHLVVDLVTTSEVSISVTLDDPSRLEAALAELEGIGRVEVRHGLAVVAVVGEGAPTRIGLPGHVFTLLGGVGIGVEMISQGASRVNLSFVVREEDADRTVRLLHRGLGLDAEAVAPAGARA